VRLFWKYDNQILGAALVPLAISSWIRLIHDVQANWVYIYHGIYATPLLSLSVVAFSALYTSIISLLLITKPNPLGRYEIFIPNFLALLGGFGVYLFALLTPAYNRPVGVTLPLLMLLLGSALVLLSLIYLRRSFSVTPQARLLSHSGPYGVVRHPMYVGNIISLLGLGLLIGTSEAVLLSLVMSAIQIGRASFEERLLLSHFPTYGAYMAEVGGFVPRIRGRMNCPSSEHLAQLAA
jgi:protein-S-isoprenylcysteine O-methyltransferase Ste14